MNSRLLVKARLACLFLLAATVPHALRADPSPGEIDASNPYSVIVERNIFHLNPPPIVDPEANKPKIELPVVKITGFVDIGNVSRVLFEAMPGKEKKDAVYYSLVEGEKSGDGKFELVKIHSSKDAVDVINDGTPTTLTVEHDSLAPQGAPAGGKETAAAARPGPGDHQVGTRPMFPGRPAPPGVPRGDFPIPGRPPRGERPQ